MVNAYPNRKYIGYPIKQQLKDVGMNFVLSLIMAITVYFVGYVVNNMYICVALQMVIGATIYYFLSRAFNKTDYGYVMEFVKHKLKK